MKRYIIAVLVLSLFAAKGFAQDNQTPSGQGQDQVAVENATQGQPVAGEKAIQPQEISIYGEVKSINTANSSIAVQYYDYDSDEEKSIDIMVGADTKMENAAAISDIKPGNWADVMYTIVSGNNIAKSVIIEKEEEAPVEMPKLDENPATEPKGVKGE